MFGPSRKSGQAAPIIYVVAVHLRDGGNVPQDILEVIWVASNIKSGRCSTAAMIDFVEKGRVVKVSDGVHERSLAVVRSDDRMPYLRTEGQDPESDGLLSLPRFA